MPDGFRLSFDLTSVDASPFALQIRAISIPLTRPLASFRVLLARHAEAHPSDSTALLAASGTISRQPAGFCMPQWAACDGVHSATQCNTHVSYARRGTSWTDVRVKASSGMSGVFGAKIHQRATPASTLYPHARHARTVCTFTFPVDTFVQREFGRRLEFTFSRLLGHKKTIVDTLITSVAPVRIPFRCSSPPLTRLMTRLARGLRDVVLRTHK
ncbi:hypothetical protein FB45DRAFT_1054328 [Roridomyces roridus]|uniref:Uncharacterized protein n=1 Tax=Roridomyces roridus TaxID=1738132 RepID=A0AAD7FX50_9AGAR|nr:hypothetical protein FB45DRAFT_1054328 [Roridomyces roridus]